MADVISKKWCTTFGLNCDVEDVAANPTIHTLVKEYKQSIDKENEETRKVLSCLKGKMCIGSLLKNSRISLSGDQTPDQVKSRIEAAKSFGWVTTYADEMKSMLWIVPMDYPYRLLQELFGCLPNTVTAAKAHCVLFGLGGTPPTKFKFPHQWVST